ncbi:putative membrane transporter [Rosellinia necatrix]|uniref:Putative membrane transporter n=1 Tax=Rosellinia necatrix TaxID=77044 RepID=A0A1W2TC41_ROSNE|nr:putative membrane transporter [Rosellinia necatrix]
MGSQAMDEKTQSREQSLQGPTVEEVVLGLKNDSVIPADAVDITYARKAAVLNWAIKDIGMGWYQWQLFMVIGFGWASDNLWPVVTSLIFTPIKSEFNPPKPPLLSLAQNIGLLAGAIFWGFGCDIFGRRWAFNLTLGLTALWGLVAAGSPSFAAIGTFAALWSFGVGGNLPVDSAIFLEFLPASHQYLLTVLSVYWALAQVIANLIAWGLLSNFTCDIKDTNCTRAKNFGWRYFMITVGGLTLIMFIIRFVAFKIFESPKYLMGKGKDEEAVRIVHEVARRNNTQSWLTIEHLKACELEGHVQQTTASDAVKRKLEAVNLSHIRALFKTRKLGYSTGALMLVWAL